MATKPGVGAKRWLAAAVLLTAGLGIGWTLGQAPEHLAANLRERLESRAERMGLELQIGAIWVDPLSQVTLDDISVTQRGQTRPLFSAARVQVDYDVYGLSSPKVYLQRVVLDRPAIHVHRRDDGAINWLDLLTRSPSAGGGNGASGGGLRKYLSRHLPKVIVRGMAVQLDDDQGTPLKTSSGVDLRHTLVKEIELELHDVSAVQEVMELQWRASGEIDGLSGRVEAKGEIRLPERSGELEVRLPEQMRVRYGDVSVSVGRVYANSQGAVELRSIEVERDGLSSLSLSVEKVAAQVGRTPAPLERLPKWVRGRLPEAAQTVLRHIRRLRVVRPVLVGSRVESQAPSRAAVAAARAVKADPKKADSKKAAAARSSGKPSPTKPTAKAIAAKKGKSKSTRAPRDGSVVRAALSRVFGKAADRLEGKLKQVRAMMTALPFDEIVVEHGSARLRGEGSASAPKRDVSDYGLVLKRDDREISAQVNFAVAGSKTVQQIEGRLERSTGDMRVDVKIARLPLAPYAAVLPSALNLHDTSVIHDTEVSVQVDTKARTIVVDGQASVSDVDLRAPKISRHIMTGLAMRTKGRLSLDLASDTVKVTEGEFQLGKLVMMLTGSVTDFREAPNFDMQLKVPSIQCQDVVGALVPNVAPMLDGMRCRGQMSFRLDLKLNTADMKAMTLKYLPSLRRVEITSLGRYVDLSVLKGPFEHHARQPDGELYTFITGPESDRWAPLEGISDDMIKVVTTTEDGNFFTHSGFSLPQIRSAMITNLLRGRFVRGASTISQQVVKNLFFVEREKTLARKLQEAVITWHLEKTLTKQEILALYFNVIEFGPRIYGIRAASHHFFHREPLKLELVQCLWLGSIIPNPRAFYHHFSRANMRPSWCKHLCVIANIMVKREKITAAQRSALKDCEVPFGVPPTAEEPDAPGLGHEQAIDAPLAPPDQPNGAVDPADAP